MKTKLEYIIIAGPQFILACIALALLTVWIVAHLCKGNFNFPGFLIAVLIWGMVLRLARLSFRDFKNYINHHSNK